MLKSNALHNAPQAPRRTPLNIGGALILIIIIASFLVLFYNCNSGPLSPIMGDGQSHGTPEPQSILTNTYMQLGIDTVSYNYTIMQTPEVNVVGYYRGSKSVNFTYENGEYSVSSFGCSLLQTNTTLFIRKIRQYDDGTEITNYKNYNSGLNKFRKIQITKEF